MTLEVELKFIAAVPGPLEALAVSSTLGAAQLGPPRVIDELDRYLDTESGRLAAAGWACRLRTRGEHTIVSLKGPAQHAEAAESRAHRRPEIEGPASSTLDVGAWPASPARDSLDELRGGEPMRERLTLEQQRTERLVTLDGRPIATLTLDRVTVLYEGRRAGDLCVVELELLPEASEASLPALADALQATRGLAADPSTKLEHALAFIDAGARP